MNNATLWSLRLGFSGKQASLIEKNGITKFLNDSIEASFDIKLPLCLENEPKTALEILEKRQKLKNEDKTIQTEFAINQRKTNIQLKAWWMENLQNAEFPLIEKMTLFWHNHFVSTYQKVKVNYWIYSHNQTLRENAFGNFKTITKQILQTNAMVKYLDNVDNKNNNFNENLSRELLELFTLGIGNYTETDIKNGAKALAGLNIGNEKAVYRKKFENNDTKTYFGKTGNFKANDLVDIIFEQKAIPYLITKKILQWFIYDNPTDELVIYYGDFFRKENFEIKPLLIKIFTEEYSKNTQGSKIKDPMVFAFQILDELQIKNTNPLLVTRFLNQQGMDLFNQPNVKGWQGGKNWLTAQIYLQRQNAADLLCSGGKLNRKKEKMEIEMEDDEKVSEKTLPTEVSINFKTGTNKQIIAELSERLLFKTNDALQKDMEQILKYDFDSENQNATKAVIRLFNYMVKTPEFQLI